MQCKVLFEVNKLAINWCRNPPDYIYKPSKKIDTLWPIIQSYNVQHRDNVLGMDQFERRRRGPFAAWMLSHRKIREAGEGCGEGSKYHNLSVILSNVCYALKYLILKQSQRHFERHESYPIHSSCLHCVIIWNIFTYLIPVISWHVLPWSKSIWSYDNYKTYLKSPFGPSPADHHHSQYLPSDFQRLHQRLFRLF